MLTKFACLAAGLLVAVAALAQNAPSSAAPQVTVSAAKKARSLSFAGGGSVDIFEVDAGPNDTLASIEVVEDSRTVNIPGSTISAGDKPGRLKTSLSLKDLAPR